MGQVTIEGTVTPSVWLATGQRRTVEVTDDIRKLVRIGAVKVVEGSLKDEPTFARGGVIDPRPDDDSLLVPLDSGYVVPKDEVAGGEPDRLSIINQMQAEEDGPLDPEHNQFPAADAPDDPDPEGGLVSVLDDAPPEPAVKTARRGKQDSGEG